MEKLPHPFPTYLGPPLPPVLKPWNLHHYWLLFMWIFFQPSRLLHYLWQADSDLYRANGRKAFRALRQPAYRNLILIMPFVAATLTIGTTIIISWLQDRPLEWNELALGGAAAGALGMAVSVAFGVAAGVAAGMVAGVPLGVTVGVTLGATLSGSEDVMYGIAIGLAVGVAMSVTTSVLLGVAAGVALGVAMSVIGELVASVAMSVTEGVAVGVPVGLAASIGGFIGGSRLLFQLITWPFAWISLLQHKQNKSHINIHPVFWDELAVWRLPKASEQLQIFLNAEETEGIRYAAHISANPFQRGHVQQALHHWLHKHPAPIVTLYSLARQSDLDTYAFPPASSQQFLRWPTARTVLLSEIGQKFIAATSSASENSERLVWWLTKQQRQLTPTPLSRLSLLLSDLFEHEEFIETDALSSIREDLLNPALYQDLISLPSGPEIAHTLDLIRLYLSYETIGDLAEAQETLEPLERLETPLIRPAVVQALRALGDVSAQVARYQVATSLPRQTTALNLAAGRLQELESYVRSEVQPPERVLLIRVVGLWQDIVAKAQGELAQSALRGMSRAEQRAVSSSDTRADIWAKPSTPLDNPYVVGDPVYPPLLAGRTDIFNRIAEVWSAKTNPDSIILYGHRRMGKSSILRNLDQASPPNSIVVYADMAGETSFVASTGDLLLALADRLHQTLQTHFPEANLPEPDPAQYATASQAQFHFNRLTGHVAGLLNSRILILALDEFEAIEKAVEAGKISPEIFQFLRTKTQEPWLTLVFGGLHTLDEMSRDYQQPFYGSYTNIRVSYLPQDDAWRLITNPTPDFTLNYDHDAVERIIAETGGQPYLIQQLCRDALDHLNHELFDLNLKRPVRITTSDIEAALNNDFFRRGMVYFDGVWAQTSDDAQRTMLRALAQREAPWSSAELAQATGQEPDELLRHLRWAERHDILQKIEEVSEGNPPTWRFHVPLMRRWVLNK